MYGDRALSRQWSQHLRALYADGPAPAADLVVCPPLPLIPVLSGMLADVGLANHVQLGAQTCHFEEEGPFTGEVSPTLLADLGCTHVLVGHSERRRDHGENDGLVVEKALGAARAGLVPVVCIGEDKAARAAGEVAAGEAVAQQLAPLLAAWVRLPQPTPSLVVAYEPVWAIGADEPATAAQIAAMHRLIGRSLRDHLPGQSVPVLYGGSANAATAADLLAIEGVDGLLIGRAGLQPDALATILSVADRSRTAA